MKLERLVHKKTYVSKQGFIFYMEETLQRNVVDNLYIFVGTRKDNKKKYLFLENGRQINYLKGHEDELIYEYIPLKDKIDLL